MKTKELYELYFSRKNNCCICGCELEDNTGCGLGSVFVLDNDGNFYCMDHDTHFEDYDERIFEADISGYTPPTKKSKTMKMATNIKWDVSSDDDLKDLPDSVLLPKEISDGKHNRQTISEYLAALAGFEAYDFKIRTIAVEDTLEEEQS